MFICYAMYVEIRCGGKYVCVYSKGGSRVPRSSTGVACLSSEYSGTVIVKSHSLHTETCTADFHCRVEYME